MEIIEDFARICFTDNQDAQILIPANTVLRNTSTGRDVMPFGRNYFITWMNNYTLSQNGSEVFRLDKQKQHAIHERSDMATTLIQQ